MFYYLVLQKEFSKIVGGYGEQVFEWLMCTGENNKENNLRWARENNSDAFVNIHTERFVVYESEKLIKRFNKKDCKLIYPTIGNPLFH